MQLGTIRFPSTTTFVCQLGYTRYLGYFVRRTPPSIRLKPPPHCEISTQNKKPACTWLESPGTGAFVATARPPVSLSRYVGHSHRRRGGWAQWERPTRTPPARGPGPMGCARAPPPRLVASRWRLTPVARGGGEAVFLSSPTPNWQPRPFWQQWTTSRPQQRLGPALRGRGGWRVRRSIPGSNQPGRATALPGAPLLRYAGGGRGRASWGGCASRCRQSLSRSLPNRRR